MAEGTMPPPSLKSKFILKWKHGISGDGTGQLSGDPTIVAQRLMNLYRCFQVMSKEEQVAYLTELKNTPESIRNVFVKILGGREIDAFYRFVKNGDVLPMAIEEKQTEQKQSHAAEKHAAPPPPPPAF